jgi:hypothetical protein
LPSLLKTLMSSAFGAGGGGAGGAGGAPAAAGAGGPAALGIAMQAGMAYDLYSKVTGAQDAGAKRAGDVANMSPEKAAQAVAEARGQASGTNQASAYGDIASRAAGVALMPGAALGQYLGDAASKAATGKSNMERSQETISAVAMLDVLKQIATNTGGDKGNSGPNGSARHKSLLER